MKVETFIIPAHWLPAIVNDDMTGLSDDETEAVENWLQEVGPLSVGTVGEPFFARYHTGTPYGVLPCDCVDAELLLQC